MPLVVCCGSQNFSSCGDDGPGLTLAEMRNGFRCPIPHLGGMGMRMRGELAQVITEPMGRPWGTSEGV